MTPDWERERSVRSRCDPGVRSVRSQCIGGILVQSVRSQCESRRSLAILAWLGWPWLGWAAEAWCQTVCGVEVGAWAGAKMRLVHV